MLQSKNNGADAPLNEAAILSRIAFLQVIKQDEYNNVHLIFRTNHRDYLLDSMLSPDFKCYYQKFIDDAIEEYELQLHLLNPNNTTFIAKKKDDSEVLYLKEYNPTLKKIPNYPPVHTNDIQDAYLFYVADLIDLLQLNPAWRYSYVFSPIKL